MHIKQVVVEGFKTYREATTVDFQPHLNCIGKPSRPVVVFPRNRLPDFFSTKKAQGNKCANIFEFFFFFLFPPLSSCWG